MITKVIYNHVPNNTTGQMGYSERSVGVGYQIDHRWGKVIEINKGWDSMTYDPVVEIVYETDGLEQKEHVVHTIPFKNLELYYEEDRGDNQVDA